jgi:hypothetical protein
MPFNSTGKRKRALGVAVLPFALLLASCSDSGDPISEVPTPSKVPAGSMAMVGDTRVTDRQYEAALEVSLTGFDPLSPTRAAPEPLDPPKFTRCVSAIEARAKRDPDLRNLGRQTFLSSCEQRYEQARSATLSRLIEERWILIESDLEGLTISDQEADTFIQQVRLSWDANPAKAKRKFREAVEASGISQPDLRQRAALAVARQSLNTVGTGDEEPPGPEEAAATQLERFDAWRSKTLCASKLLVPECSNAPESG